MGTILNRIRRHRRDHDRVQDDLAALPDDERTALELRQRDNKGYGEIGRALRVPAEDVPGILVTARMRLAHRSLRRDDRRRDEHD